MADVQFNPMDPAFVADPYPTYHRLRAEDPVHHSPLGFWVLTRYADVMTMLRDPRLTKEPIAAFVAARFGMAVPPPGLGLSMLDRDPPDHTRLRGLVSKAFTPKALESLRPAHPADRGRSARRRGRQGPDGPDRGVRVPAAGPGHLRDAGRPGARPRALQGLGPRHRAWASTRSCCRPTRRWASAASPAGGPSPTYFRELIAERRAAPRDDMLSALIAAEEEGDKLNEEELLATCILLLVAGHETTVNLIGNGTLALLRHPDQLQKLRENPGLIGTAVEELLRFDGPVQRTARIPSEDVTIGGRTIPKGEMVMPFLGRGRPRPRPVPRSGPPRHHARRQPPHRLRHGHPLLPRRARSRAWRGRSRSTRCSRGCRSWPWPPTSPSSARA